MTQISKEYAEALFSLASESRTEEKIMGELDIVKAVFKDEEELLTLLCAPSVPLNDRLNVIESVFAQMLSEHVLSFLKLMCERKRLIELDSCIEEYRKLLNVAQAVVTAKVISAVPLTDSERTALCKKLEEKSGKHVVLECSVDETILGGLIVEMLGTVTDGSLRRRLKEIKEVMI